MISKTTESVLTLNLHCTFYREASLGHCNTFHAINMRLHQTMLCIQTILFTINGVDGTYLFQKSHLTYVNKNIHVESNLDIYVLPGFEKYI